MTESSVVRTRALTAAAAALLAAGALSACRSNIGTAAVVDGQRITDTQVAHYVTPKAQPVPLDKSSIGPRAFVVQILVTNAVLKKLVAKAPGGGPSGTQVKALERRGLGGKSAKVFTESQGVKGYTTAFDRQVVDFLAYRSVLNTLQQQGVDVGTLIKKTKVPVQVSSRYGTWNPDQLALDTSAGAGLPGFVSLQPGSGAAAPASTPPPAN